MTTRKTRLERRERAKTARRERTAKRIARIKDFYAADTAQKVADLKEYERITSRWWAAR